MERNLLNNLTEGACKIINNICDVLIIVFSSNIFLVSISTLVAAFAGAYGAQYIAEKNRKKESLLSEVRNINSTIMIASTIGNTCLSVKKQIVKPLKETYDKQLKGLLIYEKKNNEKKIQDPGIRANLAFISHQSLPTELLEKQVFGNTSVNARALSLTIALIEAVQLLNSSINYRNELIKDFKNLPDVTPRLVNQWYFGRPNENGNIDNSYKNSVQNIYSYLDDCIFFSMELCSDLIRYGNILKTAISDSDIVINTVDYEYADKLELLPDEKRYDSWLSMFVEGDPNVTNDS